jgi:hypothetical protein
MERSTVCDIYGPDGVQVIGRRIYSEPVDPAIFPAPGNWTHRWHNDASKPMEWLDRPAAESFVRAMRRVQGFPLRAS